MNAKLVSKSISLFIVLVIVKTLIISRNFEHLFETHHRLDTKSISWNSASWTILLFSILFFLILMKIAFDVYKKNDTTELFQFNLTYFFSSTFIILFVLHIKNRSYLFAAFRKILDMDEILSLIFMNMFYLKPYLAYFLIFYFFGYLILKRMKKNCYSPFLCVGTALMFWTLNHSYMIQNSFPFLPLVLLGFVTLLTLYYLRSEQHLLPVLQYWPVMIFFIIVGSLAYNDFYQRNLLKSIYYYPLTIVIFFTIITFLSYFLLRKKESSQKIIISSSFFLSSIILICMVFFPSSANFQLFFSLGLTVFHYFLHEFIIVIIFTTIYYFFSKIRIDSNIFIRVMMDLVAIIIIVSSYIDYRIVGILGVRLNWQVLTMCDDPGQLWKLFSKYINLNLILSFTLLMTGFKLLQLVISNKMDYFYKTRKSWISFFLMLLVLSCVKPMLFFEDKASGQAITNVFITSPLITLNKNILMDSKKFNKSAENLGLFKKTITDNSKSQKMNLVFILLESSHTRYLSLFNGKSETQPLLRKYIDRMELFCNFYSTYPDSMHARFSCFNSLYSPKKYITYINPDIKCPSLFEVLKQNGYTTSMFYSSFRTYTRFKDYLKNRKLDEFYDFSNMPHREKYPFFAWGVDEKSSLLAISDKIEKYGKSKKPFFLTYIPAAPHYPYDNKNPRFSKFTDKNSNQLLNRYKNDLLFMDWIQYEIINKLQECKLLDNTLIVITSDHGERLAENGLIGHGWDLTPELCQIPLIILNPKNKGYKLNHTPGTQVDLLKTILDLLSINIPQNVIYEGESLYRCNNNRTLYFTSGNENGLLKGKKFYRQRKFEKSDELDVYTISFNENRTDFSKPVSIIDSKIGDLLLEFSVFQESLIINYSHYLNLFRERKILINLHD